VTSFEKGIKRAETEEEEEMREEISDYVLIDDL
jgi:hypothetical protein